MMALYKWPHVTPLFGLFGTWQQPELCRRVDANIATGEETIVLSMLTLLSHACFLHSITSKTRTTYLLAGTNSLLGRKIYFLSPSYTSMYHLMPVLISMYKEQYNNKVARS
jgi:hypothetical protein